MLELKSISKTFNPGTINEKKALQELSLHLKPGDFVTVEIVDAMPFELIAKLV